LHTLDFPSLVCDKRTMQKLSAFEGNPDFVLSLARGLAVVEAFAGRTEGVTVAEVAATTGLSRAAVRRLLITLEMLGYATHSGSVYRLGTRVMRLGFSFLSSNSLATMAAPLLEELSTTFHESCSLSVLEGDEIVYVARSAAKRVMSVGLSIGSRLPAYCTSMGRVMLAAMTDEELEQYLKRVTLKAHTPKTIVNRAELAAEVRRVRRQRYAIVDEELEMGLRALAVPIVTHTGRTIAAINTGVHASRVSRKALMDRFLPALQRSAAMLAQSLA
jgi:IclR family pca regulon transcriptional regulator